MATIKPYRVKPPPPAKKIVCEKCGGTFYTRKYGQGMTKYCVVCRAIVLDEQHKEHNRQYNERCRLQRQGVVALNSPTLRP